MRPKPNHFFLRIYNHHLAKSKNVKPVNKFQKLAGEILHEEKFIEWLRITSEKEVTEKSFPGLCTQENFQKYFSAYRKTEHKKKNIQEWRMLEEELEAYEKFRNGNYHAYDVDMVKVYFKIEKLLQTAEFNQIRISKEEYLQQIKDLMEDHCIEKDLPFNAMFEHKYSIVVDSTARRYLHSLGYAIMAFDINKIAAFLSYQNSKWKEDEDFVSIVEHGVYNLVSNPSPFNNNERLAKIMQWVGKERDFDLNKKYFEGSKKTATIHNDQNIVSQSEGNKKDFFYWPYDEEKLTKLRQALIRNLKIDKNEDFAASFKNYEQVPKNRTVWKSSQRELIYLLYLIYNRKTLHNSNSLHRIGVALFKKKDSEFTDAGLNTAYNQIRETIGGDKKLSNGLKSIKGIVEDLNII